MYFLFIIVVIFIVVIIVASYPLQNQLEMLMTTYTPWYAIFSKDFINSFPYILNGRYHSVVVCQVIKMTFLKKESIPIGFTIKPINSITVN